MTSARRQDLCGRAVQFSVRLLRFTQVLARGGAVPSRMVDQLAAAGTAIGANLSEAQSAITRKQMAQCYTLSLREARESEYWLRILHDLDIGPSPDLAWLQAEASEFVAILTVSVRKLRVPAS